VTNSLLARRLIIQSGDAVSPYWDIFKEYILTKRIPFVPLTYVPSLSGRKLVSAIRIISDDRQCAYDELAERMSISVHTADNIVRDLTNMGLVSPDRQSGIFDIHDLAGEEITRRIVDFVRRHVIYGHIEAAISKTRGFRLDDIFLDVASSYSFISPNRKTLETYIKKIVNLAANVGLIKREGSEFGIGSPIQDILKVNISRKALVGTEVFRGHAPPAQVECLLEALRSGEKTMQYLKTQKLRNATFSANALGLTQTDDGIVSLRINIQAGTKHRDVIAKAALHQETINYAVEQLSEDPKLPGREIGEAISDMFQLDWSPSSANRHGMALRSWATWIVDQSAQRH
jgi:DNA-binding transcriptional regulator YhcF (GntR family)